MIDFRKQLMKKIQKVDTHIYVLTYLYMWIYIEVTFVRKFTICAFDPDSCLRNTSFAIA